MSHQWPIRIDHRSRRPMILLERMYLLLLVTLPLLIRGSLIISDGPLAGLYPVVSAGWPLAGTIDNRTLELANPPDGCGPMMPITDLVLITGTGCFPITKMRNAVAAGAKGVLILGFTDAFGSLTALDTIDRGTDIPIFGGEIPRNLTNSFVTHLTGQSSNVSLTFDLNPRAVINASPYWIFYTASIGVVNMGLIAVCLHRLAAYAYVRRFTIGTLSYILSLIGCIFRIVSNIDPTGFRYLFTFTERTVLAPFALTTTVCVAVAIGFYWLDVFDENKLNSRLTIIRRYKVHCAITLGIIVALSFAATVLQARLIDSIVNILADVLYGIVNIVILIFFIYCCYFISSYLRSFPGDNQVTRIIRKLLYLGIGQCVCLSIHFLDVAILASPIDNSPLVSAIAASILYYDSTVLAAIQIFMFANPAPRYLFCWTEEETDLDSVTFSRGVEPDRLTMTPDSLSQIP